MESYWSRFSSLVTTNNNNNHSNSSTKPRLGSLNSPSTSSTSSNGIPSSPVSSTLSNLVATARSRTRSRTTSSSGFGKSNHSIDPLTSFTQDWNAIKSNLETPDQSALHHGVSRTDIPLRLTRLLDTLVLEENGETANALAAEAADPNHAGGTGMGSCMEYVLRERVLHHLVVLSLPDRPSGILPEVIKFFSSLIVLLDSSFLARQAVHKPLVRLLRGCVGDEAGSEDFLDQDQDSLSIDEDSESEARGNFSKIGTKEALIYEPDLVDLMCHIAGRVRADPGLLLIFFQPQVNSMTLNRSQSSTSDLDRPLSPTNSDTASVDTLQPSKPSTSLAPSALEPNFGIRDQSQFEPDAFPLFAYLLRFAHREGRVGDLARAGLGFVMDVAFGFGSSSSSESNAEEVGSLSARSSLSSYILHSDFSDVLGAGLGAVYGLLPTKLAILRPSTETQSDSEDPSSTAAAGVSMLGGGMSLGAGGGTGSSNSGLESEGIDELEKLEELGIEPSTSKGLKEQIDLLVGMLEFAQTITKKAKIASFQSDQDEDEETVLPSDSNYELQRFKSEISNNVKELLIKISSSVKNLFLQNVLYPSLLECSNLDGSAIAVMSYLDVVLDVLKGEGEGEGEGVLAEVVLRYLAGWDEMEMEESFEKAVNSSGIISLDSTDYSSNNEKVPDSPTTIKKNRRKSTALLSLEDSQESKAKSRGNEIPYFTEALGRYTIQDLIGDNLELTANQSDSSSSSTTTPSTQVNTPSSTVNQACAAAALRLARTLIVRHGRFTTKALMKVQSKEGATAFPWPFSPMTQDDDLEKKGQEDDVKEDQNDNKEDSDDEFVYPGMTSEKGDNPWSTVPSSGPLKLSTTSKSQSRSSSRAQTPQVSSISLEQHLLELDIFFSLINSIDPSRSKSSKLDGSDSSSMSTTTGYENYLLDAEEALSNESTYKEGTRVLEEGMNNADSNLIPSRSSNCGGGGGRLVRKRSSSSSLGRSSSLNRGRGLTKSSSDRSLSSSISILSKKRLERLKQDPFRSQLSHHQFSPSDPFLRSLLNAMSHFFEHSPELNVALTGTLSSLALCPYRSLEGWLVFQKPPQSSTTEEKKTQEEEGIDEDHYSEDDSIDEKLRNASLWSAGQRRKKKNSSKTSPLSGSPVPIVLSLLKSLAKQVEKYRSEIKNFDSFLAERRRGLMFVENLNDALGLDSIAGEEDEQDGEGIKNGNGDGPSLCVPEISHLETEEYWKELGIQMEEEDEKSQEEEDSKVIYIPPPSPSTLIPSSTHTDITQSGTKSEPKDNSSTSTPKREGFARFFGRPPKSTEKEKEKEKVSTTTTTTIVTPFAQHYSQTASIIVKPRIASLPKGDWTSSIDPIPSTESIDGESSEINLEPEEEEVKPKKRTRFLEDSSNGKGKGRKSEDGFTYPGDESDEEEDEKVEEKKKYDGPTVTLSSVLDNIVILEEAIKELVAIIQIRRNFGIDAVRFV